VAWHPPGDNILSGEYRGRDAVLAYLREALRLSADTMRVVPVDILAGDDHVAAAADRFGVEIVTEREGSININGDHSPIGEFTAGLGALSP
jgi:ketosteroid isomerase-like protein